MKKIKIAKAVERNCVSTCCVIHGCIRLSNLCVCVYVCVYTNC